MSRNSHHRIALAAVVALAALLNAFPIGLPAGTVLLLGSYAYVPVVLMLRAPWAIAAAGLALWPTIWCLGHPFVFLLGVLEAVALIVGRRFVRRQVALIDLAYWLLVGAPLAYWLYSGVARQPADLTRFIIAKQVLNQWTAVVLAQLLSRNSAVAPWVAADANRRSRIRDLLFDHSVVLALIPLLLGGIGMSVLLRRVTEENDRAMLQESAQRVAQQIDLFLLAHQQAVEAAANIISQTGADRSVVLNQLRATHPAFITLIATDAAGTVDGSAPVTAAGASTSVRDREYFTAVRRTNATHVSNVFRGRGFGTDVLVAVSAPIRDARGAFVGVVEGSLEVHKFGRTIAQASKLPGIDLVLADRSAQVIFADARTTLKPLARLQHDPLGEFVSADRTGRAVFDRMDANGNARRYVAYATRSPGAQIVVIAERPLLDGLTSVKWIYSLIAFLVAGVLLTALVVARLASRGLSRPLEDFAHAAEGQAARNHVEPIPTPSGAAPLEITQLFSAFNTLARKLQESHQALLEQNAELDRRVAERTRELDSARDAAEQANQSKSDFLAMTSHEIRTPLTAIIGLAEISLRDAPAATIHEHLHTIHGAGTRLLEVLNDLLDLSKIEAGKLVVVPEQVELAQLCQDVVTLFKTRAQQQQLTLRLDFRLTTPSWVTIDGGRLRQVLINLVGNAIKFTPRGTVWLRVEAVTGDGADMTVRFGVRDTGPGIPLAVQKRLFEPYVQSDQRRGIGTGLGLAISRRIVGLLGGSLAVASELGRGTEFFFTLPLPRAAAPAPVAPISSPAGPAPAVSILVADDNVINQEVIRALLEPLAERLVIVGSAAEALAALAAERFDMALIDVEMPDQDGIAVATAVRAWTNGEASRDCRLIAFSAHSREQLAARCAGTGFDDFLSKPVDRKLLLRMVAGAAAPVGTAATPLSGHAH